MYKGWFFIYLIVLVVYGQVLGELLLKKGYYRTDRKGPKIRINNVTFIDGNVVTDAKYIKIGARITNLYQGAIRNLEQVTTLKLIFCAIKEVMPGAFVNLPNLTTLSLHDNDIENIRYGVFNNMSISVLFLQRNEISTIDSRAFDNMPNLFRIKLNFNKISQWDENWFFNTPHVTELFFRRNQLTEIPARAFKNIKGSHGLGDTVMVDTKIYLSKNNITSIDAEAFGGLTEFSQLWLDRNQLSHIDENLFSDITQIGAVFLSKNRLSGLPKNLFSNIKTEMLKLDLAGNHNLSCVPYEVVVKARKTNLRRIKNLDAKCVREVLEKLATENRQNEIKFDK